MSATVNAVFKDGVFKPTARPALSDGTHVRLIVEPVTTRSAEEVLHLAAAVYEGLSPQDVDDIEHMAQRRPLFG